MAKPTLKECEVSYSIKDVFKKYTLNFTDVVSNNNKFYVAECIETTDNRWILLTVYGRVGSNGVKEVRLCDSKSDLEKEAEKIIKSKVKKGYTEIKLVKSDVGSEVGKAKVEASIVSEEDAKKLGYKVVEEKPSNLSLEVQDLVRTWFGITSDYIELNLDTKKCALGQLSLDQINKGKDILEEARKIIHNSKDEQELNKLTSQFYSNIPMNFGYRRLDINSLRLDNDLKLDQAFDILDVFSNSKDNEKVFSKKSNVDLQYASLNADLEWVDPNSATWKWIEKLALQTRASNHGYLGKIKINRIFKLNRHNEQKYFLSNLERIAKECGKTIYPDILKKIVPERPDVNDEFKNLYQKGNVIPVWHSSRNVNSIGITTKGLLIRPSGVPHCGSMYGNGVYFGHFSKSIGYSSCKGAIWTNGDTDKAYSFLCDIACGNQKIADYSYMYNSKNIYPNHSVFAKAGSSVRNDEFILFHPAGETQHHLMKYIVEFQTQC